MLIAEEERNRKAQEAKPHPGCLGDVLGNVNSGAGTVDRRPCWGIAGVPDSAGPGEEMPLPARGTGMFPVEAGLRPWCSLYFQNVKSK